MSRLYGIQHRSLQNDFDTRDLANRIELKNESPAFQVKDLNQNSKWKSGDYSKSLNQGFRVALPLHEPT